MKRIYFIILLLLCYLFAHSGQVIYQKAPLVTWADISGLDYSVLGEDKDEGLLILELSTGQIVLIEL